MADTDKTDLPLPVPPVISLATQTPLSDLTEARITSLTAAGVTVEVRRSPSVLSK